MHKILFSPPREVTLTKAAASKLKELQQKLGISSNGLKFADKEGICGEGYDYFMDFAEAPEEKDEIFYSQGIRIFVPRSSLPRLEGSIVDCSVVDINHLINQQEFGLQKCFTILNPNIKEPCPCGCGNGFGC